MSSPLGVQYLYYTAELPARSVAIAKVSAQPSTPAQLTDIVNMIYLPGDLSIRMNTTLDSSPPDFLAPDYMQAVEISGTTNYRIYNQFFELTNIFTIVDDVIIPLFYVHTLPSNVDQQVTIIDINSNIVTKPTTQVGNLLYHSLDGAPYWVRYIDPSGYLHVDLLQYGPVVSINSFSVNVTSYTLTGRNLAVASIGNYWIRFLYSSGYQIITPYDAQPNTPWYPRIRFALIPPAPEWALQNWMPARPYLLATWVPGTVLNSSLIGFERPQIFYDPNNLPSILVFDQNYNIKYALDGSAPGSPPRLGTLYNWQRGLIQFIDPYKGRIQVAVDLDPTDIPYGFYSYVEPDVLFTALDVNPFTNQQIKNKVVEFYFKDNGANPLNYIYYQVIDPVTGPVSGFTNDPNPNQGTNIIFGYLAVGVGISPQQFTITDIRQRGGGLTTAYQTIPQAVNFWDLGYWDGKPYPIGGTLAVYVPASVLNELSSTDVLGAVQQSLPMGCLPVIRFYNPDGSEFIGSVNIEQT